MGQTEDMPSSRALKQFSNFRSECLYRQEDKEEYSFTSSVLVSDGHSRINRWRDYTVKVGSSNIWSHGKGSGSNYFLILFIKIDFRVEGRRREMEKSKMRESH